MPVDKSAHVRYDDSRMFIVSPYDPNFVSTLKELTKSRKWNNTTKEWIVNITERTVALNVIRQFFTLVEDNNPPKETEIRQSQAQEPLTCFDAAKKYVAGLPLEAWIDGACEPVNPGGTASYGVVVKQRNEIILREAGVVGSGAKMSNNVAEYCAVIALLEWCKTNNISSRITVHSDSRLLIKQMSGKWKTKKPKGLYSTFFQKALSLLVQLGQKRFRFQWIPSSKNIEADRLSKQVLSFPKS